MTDPRPETTRARIDSYELAVSEHQAAVLLMWNDRELLERVQERDGEAAKAAGGDAKKGKSRAKLTYMDIAKGTGLSNAELKRTLQSLACFKQCRVLRKRSPGMKVRRRARSTRRARCAR